MAVYCHDVSVLSTLARNEKTPQAPKRFRGNELRVWAWVELNYRPHAYQPTRLGGEIRLNTGLTTTSRAICPDLTAQMSESAGFNGPTTDTIPPCGYPGCTASQGSLLAPVHRSYSLNLRHFY